MKCIVRSALAGLAGFLITLAPARADDWTFEIRPYLWTPELDMTLGVGRNPPADSSTSLLEILDGAFLLAGGARRGRWSVFGEFNYLDLAGEFDLLRRLDPGWEVEGVMASANLGYAIADSEDLRVEAFAGFRGWDVNAKSTIGGRTAASDRSWIDPLIGLRAETRLGDRLILEGFADIGGFGIGSDFQWEAAANLVWEVSGSVALVAGYRHLDIDFEDRGLVWDATLTGPVFAINVRF